MNIRRPDPLLTSDLARLCPICGKRSYSAHGIHPQCAVQQADAPRQERLKRERRELKEQSSLPPKAED